MHTDRIIRTTSFVIHVSSNEAPPAVTTNYDLISLCPLKEKRKRSPYMSLVTFLMSPSVCHFPLPAQIKLIVSYAYLMTSAINIQRSPWCLRRHMHRRCNACALAVSLHATTMLKDYGISPMFIMLSRLSCVPCALYQ